jgi:hypothetical protein
MTFCETVEQKINYPCIVTARTGDQETGELVVPITRISRWEPIQVVLDFINALNRNTEETIRLRRSLTFGLNNNSASNEPIIAHDRPVSAYFFCDEKQDNVIVEWGCINPQNGEAKLHDMLHRTDRVRELIKQGMKLSSGHLAKVRAGGEYLAYFDNIGPNTQITHLSPLGKTINTLYNHGFIVLTAEGYVQLPAFI